MTLEWINFLTNVIIALILVVRLSVGNLYEQGSLLRFGLLLAIAWYIMNDLDDLLGVRFLDGHYEHWTMLRNGTAKIILFITLMLDLGRVYFNKWHRQKLRDIHRFTKTSAPEVESKR